MTSLNGYIQGLGSGAARIVRKTGTTVKLSVYDDIDTVIVFNEAGETSQTTLTGKNLFNKDDSSLILTGYIDAGATFANAGAGVKTICLPVDASTTYTVSKIQSARFRIGTYSAIPTYNDTINNLVMNDNATSLTVTTGASDHYLLAFIYNSGSDTMTLSQILDTIQIEKNPTATPYEPYCGGVPSPNPSYPQAVEGIGVKQLDDTYSVTIDYDDGDGRTGSVIASGLAYPLYEGDILDFANGKVIRANNYYTYSSAQYYGTFGADNAPLYYVLITDYNTKPIKNMQNSTFLGRLYSNMLIKITASSTPNMNNNEIRTEEAATPSRFYFRADQFADLTDLNNHLSINNLIVAAELQNTVDEPITITGDISDIGTATVTADGTLTVKYDKVEMAIRKYS